MRKFLAILVLGLALSVALTGSAAATDSVTATYQGNGLMGHLMLYGAAGQDYAAIDTSGRIVAVGVALGDSWLAPVFGAAPGPLHVRVGLDVFLDVDRDMQWE